LGDGGASQGAAADGIDESAAATVILFRAVSHAEFADATTFGVFRQGPNTYASGKFFAESCGDALQWGNALEGLGNFRVLEAEFPKTVADRFMRWSRLDGIGPPDLADLTSSTNQRSDFGTVHHDTNCESSPQLAIGRARSSVCWRAVFAAGSV
jgi:hypothetical protein